jgi:hypothetical protein
MDGSVDSRLESDIDSKVRSAILHINDKFTKKQHEFAESSAKLPKIGAFCIILKMAMIISIQPLLVVF